MTKDPGHFLRKVAKFVAHPTTDWGALDAAGSDPQQNEYAKAEIKAMIERKRRNDFVRKRELDMLRKIRREGLNPDNAMLVPSNLDSETRSGGAGVRSDIAVKAKIDAIEQQMVGLGESRQDAPRRAVGPSAAPVNASATSMAPTEPAKFLADGYALTRPFDARDTAPLTLSSRDDGTVSVSASVLESARAHSPRMAGDPAGRSGSYAPQASGGLAVEVSEVIHDPDLDEAVIAFANADFEQAERSLIGLLQSGGIRHEHADSWMVLFDLYRALDMPPKYEALAVSFSNQFGLSAPQWYSLPERVSKHLSARSASARAPTKEFARAITTEHDDVIPAASTLEGWIAPPRLDAEALGRLRCEVLQLPRPWAMDWFGVDAITAEAAALLTTQLKAWAQDTAAMTWIGVDRVLDILQEMSPTGDRDADPALWMLRLELLRLSNRPVQFDEVAIDYCVTYEQSPPSWETPRCTVRLMKDATCTQTVTLSHISDIVTSFLESQIDDEVEFIQLASMELAGQLVGDIDETLRDLDIQLGASAVVRLDCAHLIRVDFVAAGDLLNWVLSRSSEDRIVTFVNPHRLVALFFGAMGITEHAKVQLQTS